MCRNNCYISCLARFKVGQNLAIQFSTKEMLKVNWTSMIQSWYDEVTAMNPSYIQKFPYAKIPIRIFVYDLCNLFIFCTEQIRLELLATTRNWYGPKPLKLDAELFRTKIKAISRRILSSYFTCAIVSLFH